MLRRCLSFLVVRGARDKRETTDSGEASPHSKRVKPEAESQKGRAAKDRRTPKGQKSPDAADVFLEAWYTASERPNTSHPHEGERHAQVSRAQRAVAVRRA